MAPRKQSQATTTTTSGGMTVRHSGRRSETVSEFCLPSGKKILVALRPEEAARLRNGLAATTKEEGARRKSKRGGGDSRNDDHGAGEGLEGEGEEGQQTQIEVVLHGSPEHAGFLHEARQHHETELEALRARHGAAFDEWERAHTASADLAQELRDLTRRRQQRSNKLSKNFEKFGYSAMLKTYDDDDDDGDEGGEEEEEERGRRGRGGGGDGDGAFDGTGFWSAGWSGSGTTTPRNDQSRSVSRGGSAMFSATGGETRDPSRGSAVGRLTPKYDEDEASKRAPMRPGEATRLFQRPIIKQYFHRGLLWRASEETNVMSFELFFDLLFVGIIHYNGESARDHATGSELLRFVITFAMSYKVFMDVQSIVSWFETNDVAQRVSVLFVMACLLGFTTNMQYTFDSDPEHDTYIQLTSYYLAARLFGAAHLGITGLLLPLVKGFMISQVVLVLVPAALWIASLHVPMPQRIALAVVAIVVDFLGPSLIVFPFHYAQRKKGRTSMSRAIQRIFEFYPALNIEHRVERTNAFVGLVIGWAVVALLYQNASSGSGGVNSFLGKAVMGLVQAFVFNWLYFEIDGGENLHLHAIRRSALAASTWQLVHLPFVMAYTLSSAALSNLVVASDDPPYTADPSTLSYYYEDRSTPYVSTGIRFFYCHGLAIALLCTGIISATHVHRVPPGLRVSKLWRLVNRAVVCVIFFCLPAAGDRLNSTQLVAVTMCLMVWTLTLEIWGKSCVGNKWCGRGKGKGCGIQYRARCSKGQFKKAAAGADGPADRTSETDVEIGPTELNRRDGEVGEATVTGEVLALGKAEKTAVDIPAAT